MTTANIQESRAASAYAQRIGNNFEKLRELAKENAAMMIMAANIARHIGGDLVGWCKHEQMSMGFFLSHKEELPKELTFERVKRFVAAHHQHPNEVKTLYDAQPVMQLAFRGLGMIEDAKREEKHRASGQPQLVIFMNEFTSARGEYQKLIESEPIERWTDNQKEIVREQLKWAVELYERIG